MNFSKKIFIKFGKLLVTSVLLMVVFSKINFDSFVYIYKDIQWEYVILAVFITMLQTVILAWRWYRIIGFLNGTLKMKTALSLSFLGVFMNQVLPSSIGGDVFRVWGGCRSGLTGGLGVSSVVIERATGLLSLSLVVTFSAFLVRNEFDNQFLLLSIFVSGPLISGAILVSCYISSRRFSFLGHRIVRILSELTDSLRNVASDFAKLSELLFLGALASVVGLLAVYLLQKSIGMEVPISISFAIVGAVMLLSAVPISIGGWGVREASMVTLFGAVGVSDGSSLMLSLLFGVVMIIAALPGGISWWNLNAYNGSSVLEMQNDSQQKSELNQQHVLSIKYLKGKLIVIYLSISRFIRLYDVSGFWKVLYILYLTTLFASILIGGPTLGPDSSSYINNWPTRSPVYPCLLDIFGSHFYLLVVLQAIFGFYSVFIFSSKLNSVLRFSKKIENLILVILLLPFWPISNLAIANFIGTESISYSLFLLSLGFFIIGFINEDRKGIILSCIILFFLMLTRKQFVFLYPVYVVMLMCRRRWRKSLGFVLIVFLSYFSANFFEKIYNGVTTGHYSGIPFTGIQLVVRPLWMADHADAEKFSGLEKEVFKSTIRVMDARKVSLNACKESGLPIQCGYDHFLESYNVICWQILYPTLKQYGVVDWWDIEKVTLSISYKLIRDNYIGYMAEYYSAVKNGDGFYYIILLVLLIFTSFVGVFYKNTIFLRILLLVSMISLANILLVSLVEPLLQRYTFYTSFLQIALVIAMLIDSEKYKCVE